MKLWPSPRQSTREKLVRELVNAMDLEQFMRDYENLEKRRHTIDESRRRRSEKAALVSIYDIHNDDVDDANLDALLLELNGDDDGVDDTELFDFVMQDDDGNDDDDVIIDSDDDDDDGGVRVNYDGDNDNDDEEHEQQGQQEEGSSNDENDRSQSNIMRNMTQVYANTMFETDVESSQGAREVTDEVVAALRHENERLRKQVSDLLSMICMPMNSPALSTSMQSRRRRMA